MKTFKNFINLIYKWSFYVLYLFPKITEDLFLIILTT